MDSEQKKLRLGCDILVSTPGRLVALLQKKDVAFDRTQTIILDEADVLFSDVSFPLQPIGDAAPASTQFVFVTATLPDQVTQQIKAEFPGIAYLTGPGLHRIAPTIKEVLIDCSGPPSQKRTFESSFDNKREALFRSMDEAQAERTLIFCNTIAQCRNVENALLRVDRQTRVRDVYVYHSAVGGDSRDDALDMFSKRLLHRPIVMICTDRASRGLDFDNIAVSIYVLYVSINYLFTYIHHYEIYLNSSFIMFYYRLIMWCYLTSHKSLVSMCEGWGAQAGLDGLVEPLF